MSASPAANVIIHAIVPRWDEDKPRECYEDPCKSYASTLVFADAMGCKSIAFPLLAAGNDEFDHDLAIDIAVESLRRFEPTNGLALAYLVAFGCDVTQKVRVKGCEVEEAIG